MRRKIAFALLAVALLVAGVVAYGLVTRPTNSANFESDTFVTSCTVTGVGGFELRIASDSTNASVTGASISAVDSLGCGGETQTVYLDSFTTEEGGWLVPIFPSQATPAGQLAITVIYQGSTYFFHSDIPPIGTSCVTLFVPSGNEDNTTVMNGNGSYCS